jgi:glycosyltransferase involved in cell wall biosynthesis
MLRQMHIVLASTARLRGGTWRHIEDVGVQLGARGHRVTVGLLPAARELQAAATSAGLVWRPLLRTLRMNADVWHLHLHDTFEAAALAILALRRPFGAAIVTEHLPRTPGSDPDLAPDGERRRGADLARTAFKRAQLALTARTVVPSHGAARFMTRRYGLHPGDVVVVYNGVASFPAAVPPLAAPGLQVVTVGALIDQKGIDVLLAAAGRSRHPWAVTIVGAGPRRAELERMAAALAPGRARFAGWSDDPSSCLRESHVLCMPSRYESFGYAAVEAGACGRPVVGSRIDGLDEIVVPGRTGILVEPDEPDALAAALDGLWNDVDTLATLGRAAREHTHRLFTIERNVDALLSLYEDVRSLRDG